MGKLIKTNPQICMRCCYHMGFGSQPGREQKDAGHYKNIACNYLEITGHPRVLTPDGPAYDPEYCDKFEQGEKLPDAGEWSGFKIGDKPVDPFDEYRMEKIHKERCKYEYKERKAREAQTGKNRRVR